MQSIPRLSLDQLKERYICNGSSFRETAPIRRYTSAKTTSISLTGILNSRRFSSSDNTRIYSRRQDFRDIVLKADEYKPFVEKLDVRSRNRLTGLGHQARLEKFRQIASRWKNRAKVGDTGINTLSEVDYEKEMSKNFAFVRHYRPKHNMRCSKVTKICWLIRLFYHIIFLG